MVDVYRRPLTMAELADAQLELYKAIGPDTPKKLFMSMKTKRIMEAMMRHQRARNHVEATVLRHLTRKQRNRVIRPQRRVT